MATLAPPATDAAAALADALSKVRSQTTSKLDNQRQPALLLAAIEATLREQDPAASASASAQSTIAPTAYYAALVSTLEQAVPLAADDLKAGQALPEGHMLASALYLLAIVLPFVPAAILRAQAASLAQLFAPLLPALQPSAPPLRSLITALQAFFLALEPAQLSQLRQTFAALVELTIDHRPKVRRRAQEAVQAVLASPPPPKLSHPYSDMVATWVITTIEGVGGKRKKGKKEEGASVEAGIWLCAFVSGLGPVWPASAIPALATTLLTLPALASPFLTTSSYNLLSSLLRHTSSHEAFEPGKLPALLSTILSSPPPPSDAALLSPWLGIVDAGIGAYAREDREAAAKAVADIWPQVWGARGLASEHTDVRKAAEKALCGMIRYGISDAMIQVSLPVPPSNIPNDTPRVGDLLELLFSSLTALSHRAAVPSLLVVLTAFISRLRLHSAVRGPTAAELLVRKHVQLIGELRQTKSFEYRDKADEALGMAVEVCGPEWVLQVLPLNLEQQRGGKNQEGRAYLLPILRARITNASLSYFTCTLVPLSSRLFDLSIAAASSDRPLEAKVYATLTEQIWACFPAFCDLPTDLRAALTDEFAGVLANVLYTQTTLRPPVLRGLQALVEKNAALKRASAPAEEMRVSFNGLDQAEGAQNVEFLSKLTSNLLSVLFNVFGSVGREGRGMVGDVIAEYLGIANEKDISATYKKVSKLLLDALPAHNAILSKKHGPNAKAPQVPTSPGGDQPVPHTTLDLLILLVPHLSPKHSGALWDLALRDDILGSADPAVQKKAYRALVKLVEAGKVLGKEGRIEAIVETLSEADSVAAGAKRDRLQLLSAIVPHIPAQALHHIPSLLPEAVLGTKEVNEKARNAAFDLVVALGRKMQAGGIVRRAVVSEDAEMDEDDDGKAEQTEEVEASVNEYFTMVSAGLAGSTPHFISATITALARLLFEFKDMLSDEMVDNLLSTLHLFVASTNREIVKSALGFVKVAIIILPVDAVRPHLPTIVPSLLGWSSDHKNHFKAKVRHIFERLVRRFGYEDVEREVPESDRKLLVNIRKRRERAKRKKEGQDETLDAAEEDEEPSQPRTTGRDAFEDALYGSESELDDSADEGGEDAAPAKGRRGREIKGGKGVHSKTAATYIREDEDELVDLLDRTVVGHITASNPANDKRRKPGQEASRYKMDEETGKMIIEDEDKAQSAAVADEDDEADVSGRAYVEGLTGRDGFTRGQGGRVKFNKNNKRGRAIEAEAELAELAADAEEAKKRKKTKREAMPIGAEFKAKRAGGDVKKGGQQPYAYMSLAQGSKKQGRGGSQRVDITGKKRNSSGKGR